MRTVREPAELQMAVRQLRRNGAEIGFVPTMGALHEGHLSLVEIARRRDALVVVSVFVNPAQFGPGEDFDRYPRQPERDAGMLHEAGCDLLFLPEVETIYPAGSATRIHLEGAALGYEGKCRPGHFDGVATVVTILFQLVRPNFAVFGEKDAQQLAVVRQLARDLRLPVEIVAGPTRREPDGLAMSSRNAYLSPEEREAAAVLPRALAAVRAAVEGASAVRRRSRSCSARRSPPSRASRSTTPTWSTPGPSAPSPGSPGTSSCPWPGGWATPGCSTTCSCICRARAPADGRRAGRGGRPCAAHSSSRRSTAPPSPTRTCTTRAR
ncbi:MAG: pantoate--beta-alanine ligase [Thermoanaerobaculia bacterium]|nr:pantoate--beta-alanine ligase [Thermoanaerobaculia bacterium]